MKIKKILFSFDLIKELKKYYFVRNWPKDNFFWKLSQKLKNDKKY